MARNRVQFQKGLSMAEFNKRYGTEELCHAALVKMRWPDGFVCPDCGGTAVAVSTSVSAAQTVAAGGSSIPNPRPSTTSDLRTSSTSLMSASKLMVRRVPAAPPAAPAPRSPHSATSSRVGACACSAHQQNYSAHQQNYSAHLAATAD